MRSEPTPPSHGDSTRPSRQPASVGRPRDSERAAATRCHLSAIPYNAVMRVLGVDPGGQRFGLAVADATTGTVTPLEVVRYRGVRAAAAVIAAAATRHRAARVVVGLPTSADGDETPACRRSHALATAIEELGVVVELQPEHLTSDEARRRAREAGRPAGRPVDDLAAQVILEEYVARIRSTEEPG